MGWSSMELEKMSIVMNNSVRLHERCEDLLSPSDTNDSEISNTVSQKDCVNNIINGCIKPSLRATEHLANFLFDLKVQILSKIFNKEINAVMAFLRF